MSTITTHVLDTARGGPATGVSVRLDVRDADEWREVGRGTTDDDGRVRTLPSIDAGTYRLIFDTVARSEFFPEVAIVFVVNDAAQHYHVPLLLSPFGYSTYRGS